MTQTHCGGCLCGDVRFVVAGRPLQVSVCHCRMCQRATGSAFSVEPIFLKERVEFSGQPLSYYSHRSVDHGRMVHFSFCRRCGNRIGLTLERFPAVQIIYGGTFDEPSWVAPTSHIFTDSALSWFELPAGVPCFGQHMLSPGGEPIAPLARGERNSR